ncbi:hypothetical protein J3A78_002125 [Streptomyces sp. PvR006]|uniref:DUF6907 domain-containing protein n=1 Tax=Streptomyces sp. PvR006 TaxID=2817860 RepID=UPI001AE2F7F3|nr:hypothetical protein [Streptomyces sp. PvR006]MBP2581647.1 hypothetical protein [Streptomyces sp. PvR006]
MKTYTGPTLGGAVATIQCPEWCVIDHEYEGDHADDTFHEAEPLELAPPRDRDRNYRGPIVPLLDLRLRLHSTERTPDAALVWLQYSEYNGDGIELDVRGLDQLLARLDTYRAGVADLREKLAAAENERRRR